MTDSALQPIRSRTFSLACRTSSASDSVSRNPCGWIVPGVRIGSLSQLDKSRVAPEVLMKFREGRTAPLIFESFILPGIDELLCSIAYRGDHAQYVVSGGTTAVTSISTRALSSTSPATCTAV